MTITSLETGEVITHGRVRDSIAIAKSHGEKFFEQIVWQVENEVWTVLGYQSWDEMREAEYADLGVVAPRADRPELVSRLRAKGLTQKSIADTVGASRNSVAKDIANAQGEHSLPTTITDSRGQQRPATYQRRDPEPEVVDAEIVDEPTAPEPPKPRRRPITDQSRDAGWELRKIVERVQRISEDDRFTPNKEQVTPLLRGHLQFAIEVCQDLLDQLNQSQED